jgi:hypothetical protein
VGWKTGFHNLFVPQTRKVTGMLLGNDYKGCGVPAIMIGKLKVLRQAMPNLKKSRRVPGKLEHPTSDMVALPEPSIFDWYCIKARLPGRSRQRIFQKQRYTHSHDVATLVCRALWKENWKMDLQIKAMKFYKRPYFANSPLAKLRY